MATFGAGIIAGAIIMFFLMALATRDMTQDWVDGYTEGLMEEKAEEYISQDTIPRKLLDDKEKRVGAKRKRAGFIAGMERRIKITNPDFFLVKDEGEA